MKKNTVLLKLASYAEASNDFTKLYLHQEGLKDWIDELPQKGTPKQAVWVWSPSGTGKSWLLAQIQGHRTNVRVFDLDKAGYKEGRKWLLRGAAIPEADVYFGTADNAAAIMLPRVARIAIIVPSLDLYRLMQRAKAEDGAGMNLPSEWLTTWRKLSTLTEAQYFNEMKHHYRLVRQKVGNVQIDLLDNSPHRLPSKVKGWF